MARDDIATIVGGHGASRSDSCVSSTYELADGAPESFHPKRSKTYRLRYEGMVDGQPTFSSGVESDPVRSLWGRFLGLFAQASALDIRIKEDTLVTVETIGDLYWSTRRSALMTRRDRTGLYGELRYLDGDQWKRRSEIDPELKCRKIRFKARRRGFIITHSHAFSFNVQYPAGGGYAEYEIDPDIKNPSM